MSSVLAVKLVSGLRRKPKPSGRISGLGALLDDGEHQLLLAHAAGVFDLEFLGLLEDFRDVQCLEFV